MLIAVACIARATSSWTWSAGRVPPVRSSTNETTVSRLSNGQSVVDHAIVGEAVFDLPARDRPPARPSSRLAHVLPDDTVVLDGDVPLYLRAGAPTVVVLVRDVLRAVPAGASRRRDAIGGGLDRLG